MCKLGDDGRVTGTGRRIVQLQTSRGGGTLWWDNHNGDGEQIDVVVMDEYHFVVARALQALRLAGGGARIGGSSRLAVWIERFTSTTN